MNREEFDKLNLSEQVDYINNLKKRGLSMKAACKTIGIAPSTFGSRLTGKYRLENNLYVPNIEVVSNSAFDVIHEQHKSVTDENTVISTDSDVMNNNTNMLAFDNMSYDDLKNILISFQETTNKVNEMYSWYENNTKVLSNNTIQIEHFDGEVITRSYRLYSSIRDDFAEFCKEHNNHKVQELVSQALKEFMDKYK